MLRIGLARRSSPTSRLRCSSTPSVSRSKRGNDLRHGLLLAEAQGAVLLDQFLIGQGLSAGRDAVLRARTCPVALRKERLLALKKEELLREIVDNVGKRGMAGQDLQNVISVAMLSEGWDAKNVTHIIGLRAFTSQLLCEQVIGRGLRRVSYDTDDNRMFQPEYVNVFGVHSRSFRMSGRLVRRLLHPSPAPKSRRWPNEMLSKFAGQTYCGSMPWSGLCSPWTGARWPS